VTDMLTSCFCFSEKQFSFTEKQRYDGWFNNLAHPQWGSIGMSKLIIFSIIYTKWQIVAIRRMSEDIRRVNVVRHCLVVSTLNKKYEHAVVVWLFSRWLTSAVLSYFIIIIIYYVYIQYKCYCYILRLRHLDNIVQ